MGIHKKYTFRSSFQIRLEWKNADVSRSRQGIGNLFTKFFASSSGNSKSSKLENMPHMSMIWSCRNINARIKIANLPQETHTTVWRLYQIYCYYVALFVFFQFVLNKKDWIFIFSCCEINQLCQLFKLEANIGIKRICMQIVWKSGSIAVI